MGTKDDDPQLSLAGIGGLVVIGVVTILLLTSGAMESIWFAVPAAVVLTLVGGWGLLVVVRILMTPVGLLLAVAAGVAAILAAVTQQARSTLIVEHPDALPKARDELARWL